MSAPDQQARLEQLLEVMLAIARQDFDVKAPVGDDRDVIDAIAVGLNMLADELRGEVASRSELERAHDGLKRTQAQLVHAGKLAAIGQLAAGVAHEINNPIQSVQLCLAIVQRTQKDLFDGLATNTLDLDRARSGLTRSGEAIADAVEAIERVRGVTSALRTFARVDDESFTAVPLDEVIRVSLRLSESTLRTRARLELDIPAAPLIRGSRGKLGQVVTNLLVNALQALPEGDPERHLIKLTLRHTRDAVSFVVEDTGPGVREADRRRIFEPFFTTKPPDVGMGLGLALVAEIVLAHCGTIAVGDSPLGGARFEIVLPTTALRDPAPSTPMLRPAEQRPRVLLVDDEEMLLRSLQLLLAEDCDVVIAGGGAEALEILRVDRRFDLVLCDLQMPGVNGPEVHEAVISFAPELGRRFVFMTGGSTTTRGRAFLDATDLRVLHKPFKVAALLALLRD